MRSLSSFRARPNSRSSAAHTDYFMPALLIAVSRPLPLVKLGLRGLRVSSTTFLSIFNSLAPTLRYVKLCHIQLTDAIWRLVFDNMATRLQLDRVHLGALYERTGGYTQMVYYAEVQRQRPVAYGSEWRGCHPEAEKLEKTWEGDISPELDDGFVWVFRNTEYEFDFDEETSQIVLDRSDGLDDVEHWWSIIRDHCIEVEAHGELKLSALW